MIVDIGAFIAAKTEKAVERTRIGRSARIVHILFELLVTGRLRGRAFFVAVIMAVA